jgi:hypothetical protein
LDNPQNVNRSAGIPVSGITILENPNVVTLDKKDLYFAIDIKKGGNDKHLQGSWIHPDLAVPLAQWISPSFSIQVSRWIRELALIGSVILGK